MRGAPPWPLLKAVSFHLLSPVQMAQSDTSPQPSVPAAWPLLLTKEQMSAYLALSWSTIAKVCTVVPVDIGANVIRYNRLEVDEWVAGLPSKAIKRSAPAAVIQPAAEDHRRRQSALDKIRARTQRARSDHPVARENARAGGS
ncbi:hypothetical protein D3C72_513980 [compost metagenome]